MAETAADVLVEGLIDWGVDTVFGMPGDGINGIMEALRTRQDRVRFIQVRHEEAAAFMACAHAKYTGRLACCLATSGPGGIHLLNGLYDAKLDQAPVIAITGQTFSDLKGSNFQQEVNMVGLFADVTVYNQEVINPNQVPMLVNEACRHALNQRGVAHITFPVDYQEVKPSGKFTMHKVEGHTSSRWTPRLSIPPAEELGLAASVLNQAQKPVILVGQGALGATDEVIELADKLGAPIVKALLGKAVVPDDHPLTIGGLGLLGTTPSQEAMEQCDTLLIIGSSFPYMEYLPRPGQAKGVQIDDKPDRIGLRYPVSVGLVGNAKPTVAALLKLIARKEDRAFLEGAQAGMKEWWELMKTRAKRDEVPIKPQRVAWELSELAADDCIISTDSGTITTWVARYFKMRGTQKFSCSGTLATMAPGLPYAIAAKIIANLALNIFTNYFKTIARTDTASQRSNRRGGVRHQTRSARTVSATALIAQFKIGTRRIRNEKHTSSHMFRDLTQLQYHVVGAGSSGFRLQLRADCERVQLHFRQLGERHREVHRGQGAETELNL